MLHTFSSVAQDQETFLIRHPQFAAGMQLGGNVYRMFYALISPISDADLLQYQNLLIPFEACTPLHAGFLFGWINAYCEIHGQFTSQVSDFTSGWIYAFSSSQHLCTLDSDLELVGFLSDFLNKKTALSREMETLEARAGYVCGTIAGLLVSRDVIERIETDQFTPRVLVPAGEEVTA